MLVFNSSKSSAPLLPTCSQTAAGMEKLSTVISYTETSFVCFNNMQNSSKLIIFIFHLQKKIHSISADNWAISVTIHLLTTQNKAHLSKLCTLITAY